MAREGQARGADAAADATKELGRRWLDLAGTRRYHDTMPLRLIQRPRRAHFGDVYLLLADGHGYFD